MNFLTKRLLEPSTWASIAACAAIVTGHDPAATANNAMQVVGGLASLLGVLMAENNNTPKAG